MPKPEYVKGLCGQCGGHLEFPADAAGAVIECPHCGKPTELTIAVAPQPAKSRAVMGLIAATTGIAVVLVVLFWLMRQGDNLRVEPLTANASATVQSNAPVAAMATVVAPVTNALPAETLTNEFALSPFKLEKTPGSSLVYVTGAVRNLSDRQRFGVKIEFELFDAETNAVGTATDYQSMLDPHGEWHFKALVMESKAASAQLNSITEN
jgi:hypothetical protein